MALTRKKLPILLYFYQVSLTQAEADKVVDAFSDKDVHFRKVADINDTRDMTERCAYAAGTVPLIYFVRKSPEVLTDGVLADPLKRPNAAKPTTSGNDTEAKAGGKVSVTTGHAQPTDAVISAKLLQDELGQKEQAVADPDIKSADVKVDPVASGATTEADKKADEAALAAKSAADDASAAAAAAAANKAKDEAEAKAKESTAKASTPVAPKSQPATPVAPVAPSTPVAPK